MQPLVLLLIVSGCLGASLENGVSTDINMAITHGGETPELLPSVAKVDKVDGASVASFIAPNSNVDPTPLVKSVDPSIDVSPSTVPKVLVASTTPAEVPLKKEVIGNILPTGNLIDATAYNVTIPREEHSVVVMVTDEHLVTSSSKPNVLVEETSALPQPITPPSVKPIASTASVLTSQEPTTTLKTVPTQGHVESTISNSTTLKPEPTETHGTSPNVSMSTTMKPISTVIYVTSANISNATTMKPTTPVYKPTANISMATTMKPSTQGYGNGTTTHANSSTTAGLKTTPGNTVVTTTAAPKKNDASSSSISMLLSVVPVVLSVVLIRS